MHACTYEHFVPTLETFFNSYAVKCEKRKCSTRILAWFRCSIRFECSPPQTQHKTKTNGVEIIFLDRIHDFVEQYFHYSYCPVVKTMPFIIRISTFPYIVKGNI